MKKQECYIVKSVDGKWYATSEFAFTDKVKDAKIFNASDADKIVSSISVMKLEKIAA